MPASMYLKIALAALFVFLFSCIGILIWIACELVSVGIQLLGT